MDERDDFGLPIRRAARTPNPATTEDETRDPATAATSDAKVPSTPTTHDGVAATMKKENGVTETDSENETFEDARSMATSEATASPTKTANDDRPQDTPEPPTSVKGHEQPSETPGTTLMSPSADEQPTPKADAVDKDPMKDAKPLEPTETSKNTTEIVSASDSKQVEEPETKSTAPPEPQAQPIQSSQAGHNRNASIATQTSVGEAPVGAFSHQSLPPQTKDDEEAGDDDWQEMPSYARYDMYNDDDKLIAKERLDDLEDDKMNYSGLGGAGKGYTRVQMDEDAESATSMDDHTNYLFNNKQSTGAADGDDEQARDAVSQMQATKDLLTEGQRIAYVGIVRLEVAGMIKEREDMPTTKKIKKDTTMAAEATKMWGQRMMIRLYAHMDISEAEQIMIEQLAEHGVVPGDLTPALLTNARVANPMAGEDRISEEFDEHLEDKADELTQEAKPSADQDDSRTEQRPRSPQYEDNEEPAKPPPPYEAIGAEELPEVKTPSQMPHTAEIEIDLRWTVLCDLFLILIADSVYDSRSRVLLERVGASLEVPELDICRFEKRVTDALEMQQAADKENWNEEEHMESRRKRDLKKRYMMMGLATVGGGLVIGLSAGLLAPVIGAGLAAGFTTIGVGGTSAFLGGVGGAAIITTTAATSGGIVGVRAANRRTGAVKTFEYRPLYNNKRVNLVVTISGWLTGKMDDVRLPFSTIDPVVGDIYSILWEPEMLRSMGDTINILATEALTTGLQQVLGNTFLTVLMAGLQVPVILSKLSYLIDNPWAVSLDRAWSAGQILADSIIERNLGTRPITLVGYSIGARVIFSCLMELAKKGAYGLIQGVYMFGSPIVVKKEEYLKARGVVSGRFVNGYHNNDWILGYLFRLTNGGIRRIAGLAPITEVDFVENVDVTELVKGHMEYRTAMPSLLLKCGWPVESEEFTEIEEPDPENHGQRQRELINEIEEARKELEREGKASQKSKFGLFSRRKKTDKAEWEVYEEKDGEEATRGGGTRKPATDNGGVLFDVDAIRAELAKEQMGYGNADEELQIREIKSTLPPMKIDVSPSPTPSPSSIQRPLNVRGSQSADVLPPRPSYSSHVSGSRAPSGTASPSYLGGSASPAPRVEPPDDGIQMSFDSDDDDASKRPPPPPKQDDPYGRPGMRSSNTLPNMNLHDPWADPDDEDFGKEKEMTMTFA